MAKRRASNHVMEVAVLFEAFLRERRAGDVPAESLESPAIATIDRRTGVHVHAADISDPSGYVDAFAKHTRMGARTCAAAAATGGSGRGGPGTSANARVLRFLRSTDLGNRKGAAPPEVR